jgi:multidrug efflux pump subunit AcrB
MADTQSDIQRGEQPKGGPVYWFIHNPIAANLLMLLLLLGGLLSIPGLEKQFFPTPEISQVVITMPYPGAGPREVEEQLIVRVEEAIHDLTGIEEIRSTAREGVGTVIVEAEINYPVQRLTTDIKTRVDALDTLPVDAERPLVAEQTYKHFMSEVVLWGDLDERELKDLGERLRDEMARLPYISIVELSAPRPYEVSINVSEADLRRFGLTFDEVVAVVRATSLNLPAGAIAADDGDIRVQTRGQAYDRADFDQIVLLTSRDGTEVRLGDIAQVVDGFEDIDVSNTYNGKPALRLRAFVTSKPDALKSSRAVHDWIDRVQPTLPQGVTLSIWRDVAVPFGDRLRTLLENGIGGLILVAAVLILFLRPKLALWVSSGIAVAFLATVFFLPYFGVSLNMLSMFSFLLVLGIVVDDAIIVGESVHSEQERGWLGEEGARRGVKGVVKPVMFAVISTMVFFVPMLLLPGDWAEVARSLAVVVILALTFSLVECLLILPAHLAHMAPEKPSRFSFVRRLEGIRHRCADWMTHIAQNRYRPFLAQSLRHYWLVGAVFLVAFSISIAMLAGGWLRSAFFPRVNSDYVFATVEMPEGGAFATTLAVQERILTVAEDVKRQWNERAAFRDEGAIGAIASDAQGNMLSVVLETLSEDVDTAVLARELREAIGPVPEAKEIRLDFTIRDPGKPINLVMASKDMDELIAVSAKAREALASYAGVFDISDTFDSPRDEVVLALKPAAETLGITLGDVARQVRQAFYGAEAQRIPRGREDVRVMVRYPEQERRSLGSLESMYLRAPDGTEVPFDTVATYSLVPGYQKIERLDRMRTLEIRADVKPGEVQPRAVVDAIIADYLPAWQQAHPGLIMRLDGELQEEEEFSRAFIKYFGLSMLVIYGLMAIAFRSYAQPLLVLTAVPFGLMGAIYGHAILDWQVSMFSMLGVLACAGVVVNDNLVLIDRINTLRDEGADLATALLQGGEDRFRPIILTSLTTFVGLLPIMSETSVQAQFLIPMVTSLAFGVLFATGVTLLLVPALYLMAEDLKARIKGLPKTALTTPEPAELV